MFRKPVVSNALAAARQPSASAGLACMIVDIFDCTIDDAQRALPSFGFNSAPIAFEPAREVRSAGFGSASLTVRSSLSILPRR